jgi:hypothetical protein
MIHTIETQIVLKELGLEARQHLSLSLYSRISPFILYASLIQTLSATMKSGHVLYRSIRPTPPRHLSTFVYNTSIYNTFKYHLTEHEHRPASAPGRRVSLQCHQALKWHPSICVVLLSTTHTIHKKNCGWEPLASALAL